MEDLFRCLMHMKPYWQSPHINCIKSWVWMHSFRQRKQKECCLFLDSFLVVKFLLLWKRKFYHFAHKIPLLYFWITCLIYSAGLSFLSLQAVYILYTQFAVFFIRKPTSHFFIERNMTGFSQSLSPLLV